MQCFGVLGVVVKPGSRLGLDLDLDTAEAAAAVMAQAEWKPGGTRVGLPGRPRSPRLAEPSLCFGTQQVKELEVVRQHGRLLVSNIAS